MRMLIELLPHCEAEWPRVSRWCGQGQNLSQINCTQDHLPSKGARIKQGRQWPLRKESWARNGEAQNRARPNPWSNLRFILLGCVTCPLEPQEPLTWLQHR
jgi:hypothetical protein